MLFNFIVALILKHDFTETVKNVTLVFGDVIASALFMTRAASKDSAWKSVSLV